MNDKKIKNALISVFCKDGLDAIVESLASLDVKIFSTGGTYDFIESMGVAAEKVEDLTSYPSILGGRVKTLHPLVFGGILGRRDNPGDIEQMEEYGIPEIDLVIVDLYPFKDTVKKAADHQSIIEKIDIGGISLIRAAAKNYKDVLIISNRNQYVNLVDLLDKKRGETSEEERRGFATEAFLTSSGYDTDIFNYLNKEKRITVFRESIDNGNVLRYGENPHQRGVFYGDAEQLFQKLHGKDLSYNNLLDVDSALGLIDEFKETTMVIIKHNNACGVASRENLKDAWKCALECDPVSAFGGVIVTNSEVDEEVAGEMDKLFFEIVIAPGFTEGALSVLKHKKNRIILKRKEKISRESDFRSLLNGVLWQEKDNSAENSGDMQPVTPKVPDNDQIADLVFANIIVKHSKSNAIVLAKNRQLCASGIGQTSRIDSLKQAIEKSRTFGMDLKGAVMASDAFFPFPDSVEIADKAGIKAVVQPGGSVRDNESIEYCTKNGIAMVFTGVRHFKH